MVRRQLSPLQVSTPSAEGLHTQTPLVVAQKLNTIYTTVYVLHAFMQPNSQAENIFDCSPL